MGVGRSFSSGGKVEILLIVFRLLTMQCKLTFTKHKENALCYGNSHEMCFIGSISRVYYDRLHNTVG